MYKKDGKKGGDIFLFHKSEVRTNVGSWDRHTWWRSNRKSVLWREKFYTKRKRLQSVCFVCLVVPLLFHFMTSRLQDGKEMHKRHCNYLQISPSYWIQQCFGIVYLLITTTDYYYFFHLNNYISTTTSSMFYVYTLFCFQYFYPSFGYYFQLS